MAFENCSEPLMCRTDTELVGYLLILPLVSGCGIVFNIMNLLVMYSSEFRLPIAMKFYLIAMAFADLIASFLIFFLGFARCLPILDPDSYGIRIIDWYIIVPVGNICGTLSAWTNVAVAFQRYSVLRHHTNYRECGGSCKPEVSKAVIAVSGIVAALLNSVLFLPRFNVYANGCVERLKWYESNFFTVWSWLRLLLAKILPIFAVLILNALLIHFVWKNYRYSQTKVLAWDTVRKGDLWRKKHHRLTLMLIGISLVYLVCNIPEPLSHYVIFAALFGKENRLTDQHFIFRVVINIMEAICFAINFLFYCGFNKNFRSTLSMVCRRKNAERKEGPLESAAPSFVSRSPIIR